MGREVMMRTRAANRKGQRVLILVCVCLLQQVCLNIFTEHGCRRLSALRPRGPDTMNKCSVHADTSWYPQHLPHFLLLSYNKCLKNTKTGIGMHIPKTKRQKVR